MHHTITNTHPFSGHFPAQLKTSRVLHPQTAFLETFLSNAADIYYNISKLSTTTRTLQHIIDVLISNNYSVKKSPLNGQICIEVKWQQKMQQRVLCNLQQMKCRGQYFLHS